MGQRSGYGVVTKRNGDHFEGHWVNDKRVKFTSKLIKYSLLRKDKGHIFMLRKIKFLLVNG